MAKQIRLFVLFILLCTLLPAAIAPSPTSARQEGGSQVLVLTATGPVAPAMEQYISRGIAEAERRGAGLVVLQLSTPGGSVVTMNNIVQTIRGSQVPVVVYVTPRGAMAASAGTLITLAGHAAAMAPETFIGAASPVGGAGEDLGETAAAKEKSALKATVRSLAERRGERAIALGEAAIDNAAAASASEALDAGLVDFIAPNLNDLLRQLDGFTVQMEGGPVTLQTAFAQVTPFEPSWLERLLAVLTNPNIVFLLVIIGVQAILIEISSPGGWLAGFIGVVCLSLGAYGLGVLPVNWFGAVFLVVAFVLFLLDIKAPTHGALTAAGVASLIVGALILFNSPSVPAFTRVSVPLVVFASLFTGSIFFVILIFALRSQHVPVLVGQESLVGRVGVVRRAFAPHGIVQVGGEQWTADLAPGEAGLGEGERVEVVAVDGLRLVVRRAAGHG